MVWPEPHLAVHSSLQQYPEEHPTLGKVRLLYDMCHHLYNLKSIPWSHRQSQRQQTNVQTPANPRQMPLGVNDGNNSDELNPVEVTAGHRPGWRHIQGVGNFQQVFIASIEDKAFPFVHIVRDLQYQTDDMTSPKSSKQPPDITIVVRGSSSVADWMRNFTVGYKEDGTVVDGQRVNCHEGFLRAAKHLMPKIQGHLAYVDAWGMQLRFTGHSLGGAVAAILGCMFKTGGYNVAEVVTFGQPMFTDKAGADLLMDRGPRLYRIINKWDLVPTVPPSHLYNYHHFGYVCNLGDAGSTPVDEDAFMDNAVRAVAFKRELQQGVAGHLRYRNDIARVKDKFSDVGVPFPAGLPVSADIVFESNKVREGLPILTDANGLVTKNDFEHILQQVPSDIAAPRRR